MVNRTYNRPRSGFTPPRGPFIQIRVSNNPCKFDWGRRIKPNFYSSGDTMRNDLTVKKLQLLVFSFFLDII
jgi:hypothetical protein